jgi:hypothetical protein
VVDILNNDMLKMVSCNRQDHRQNNLPQTDSQMEYFITTDSQTKLFTTNGLADGIIYHRQAHVQNMYNG